MDRIFIPTIAILVIIGAFGLYRLNKIESARVPISIENPSGFSATSSTPAAILAPKTQQGAAVVTSTPEQRKVYVASRTGTAYYLPSCAAAKRIAEKNKVWFETKQEAEKAGYKPAQNCKGL